MQVGPSENDKININVLLLSSADKEEKWKEFFQLITRNKIKINWLKRNQNVDTFCIIAIKPHTEKVEAAVTELRNKYADKIQGARQIFIFFSSANPSSYENDFHRTEDGYKYTAIKVDNDGEAIYSRENLNILYNFWALLAKDDNNHRKKRRCNRCLVVIVAILIISIAIIISSILLQRFT